MKSVTKKTVNKTASSTKANTAAMEQPPMRTVMVAAPAYDGKIDVWNASALTETCKIGIMNNINVVVMYMSYDALIQRARNDIFKIAAESNIDDLFFIDCDVDWNPQDFFRLLSHDVGMVAAPIVKKSDMETYSVKIKDNLSIQENGLIEVAGVATGFMRIRRDAIQQIWEASEEYKEPHKDQPSRMVFDVRVIDGELWSEDIVFCDKYIETGGKVWIDPVVNCGHTGTKRWVGNFYEWIKLFHKR